MTTVLPEPDLHRRHAGEGSEQAPRVVGAPGPETVVDVFGGPGEPPGVRRTAGRTATAAILLAFAVFGIMGWRHVANRQSASVEYKTAAVSRREVVGRTTATGTVSALVTIQVGTQVSGRIQKLFADFDSRVKRGDIIAQLDPQLFDAAVQQARANCLVAAAAIASAEATARNAEKQAARTRRLRQQNLAAEADLDTAEANVGTARAAVDGAKASLAQAAAQLHQAQINLSYTKITAPIDGVVLSRSVDVGQTVAASLASPTLFTIAQDLARMQVDTNVAEGDVGRLAVGMPTSFTVDAYPERRFIGVVRQIRNAASTSQTVVTYDAVIDADNADLRLRPGMTANVTIVYAQRSLALAVPSAAMRFRPARAAAVPPGPAGTRTLWVAERGALRPVVVEPGIADGAFTEVVGQDLKEGDAVVVQANGGETTAPRSTPLQGGRPPPMF